MDRSLRALHTAAGLFTPLNTPCLAAVRGMFEILHAFCHEQWLVLIDPDHSLSTRICQLTSELLATMTQTTKTGARSP